MTEKIITVYELAGLISEYLHAEQVYAVTRSLNHAELINLQRHELKDVLKIIKENAVKLNKLLAEQ